LQADYTKFEALNTEILCILREEKEGIKGAAKMAKKTGAEFPILLDLGSVNTAGYSVSGFHTYLIDKDGVIRKDLAGTKAERPTSAPILKELKIIEKK
jgi:peroxiredoxin